MKNETVLEIYSRSLSLESALEVLGYSMKSMEYIDNDEAKLRDIARNIAGNIECLLEYQDKTTDVIEKLRHEIETDDAPDRADEADGLDYEKIEKAALDTDNARATIGCIIDALRHKGGDNTDTKIDGTSCWQVRASLEGVYKILEDTALIFFEVSELIERMERVKNEEDHGQDSI